MLGNAARLTRRHRGLADVVQQRRLAVVNVPHDGNNRRSTHSFGAAIIGDGLVEVLFDGIGRHEPGGVAKLFHQQCCGILIEHLIDGCHNAHLEQTLDQLG